MTNRSLKQYGIEFVQKYVSSNPEEYPQESINSIIINDTEGLERVLKRTSKNESKEWGALFNGEIRNEVYIINQLYDWNHEFSKRFIGRSSVFGVEFIKGKDTPYSGTLHYHTNITPPFSRAKNYSINYADKRSLQREEIGLLTFNIHGTPELIGFNNNYVFLPLEKNNELILSPYSRVLEYLA